MGGGALAAPGSQGQVALHKSLLLFLQPTAIPSTSGNCILFSLGVTASPLGEVLEGPEPEKD